MKTPHALCIPLPAQGHINPMLKLAKLLHSRGFHVTFVHTDFNHRRLSDSGALKSLPDFRFETVSDGLPSANRRGILDLPALCESMPIHCLRSFRDLVARLNASPETPPVTCVVSDGVMSFTLDVAEELGVPAVVLFTPSACGMLGYFHFQELKERGYFPLKDESCLTNGYLDTEIDWIPAMRGIRLKDLPTFIRTTDPNDTMFNYNLQSVNNASRSKTLILNTFDDLENEVLDAIKTKFPNLYTIGPLSLLHPQNLHSIESNLWEQDDNCIDWLNKRDTNKNKPSVVYVNFGSLVKMTRQQMHEFAWGLANSGYPFLWVIRPDSVDGGDEVMSAEFVEEVKDRGMVVGWCPQEEVLRHGAVGGFLTHCGWNSVVESIGEGVPMICWPFFAEQQTNCFYCCSEGWGVGMEMDGEVRREKVEGMVRELMEGEKGREMRERAMQWKERARKATNPGGSSYSNFNMLVNQLKQKPFF